MNFRIVLAGFFCIQFLSHLGFSQKEFVVNLALNRFQNPAAKDFPMVVGFGGQYKESVSRHFQLGVNLDFFTQKRDIDIKITDKVVDRGKQRLIMIPTTFHSLYFLSKDEHIKPFISIDAGVYFMQTKLISKFKALKPELAIRPGFAPGLGLQYMLDESIGFIFTGKYHFIYAKNEPFKTITFQAGMVLNFEGYL
jgi:outer membrane protein W